MAFAEIVDKSVKTVITMGDVREGEFFSRNGVLFQRVGWAPSAHMVDGCCLTIRVSNGVIENIPKHFPIDKISSIRIEFDLWDDDRCVDRGDRWILLSK